MAELNIGSGVKSYIINGCEIKFNPTDAFFTERLCQVLFELDAKRDEKEKEIKAAQKMDGVEGLKKIFELSRRYDKEMRDTLDNAVGAPISQAVAGDISIFAVSEADLPLYVDVIMTLIDQMDAGITAATKAMNPKLEKYVSKYQKRYEKK